MAKKRILIADDDLSILKMTKFRLEHEGYEVVAVTDGEEALHQAEAQLPIHLFLVDIKMPKLNGYELCLALKQRAATVDIPVIVFTGSESQIQRLSNKCIEAGATDWIKKPFLSRDLMEKIHRALGEEESHG